MREERRDRREGRRKTWCRQARMVDEAGEADRMEGPTGGKGSMVRNEESSVERTPAPPAEELTRVVTP